MQKNLQTILTFIISFSLLSNTVMAKTFIDTGKSYQFNKAVDYLSEKKIINGYTDGTFRPYSEINRAEFLKIVLISSEAIINDPKTNCFSDTPYLEWYNSYICTAKLLGLINGYNDGTFKPDKKISGAEALKIIGEAYDWKLESQSLNEEWYSPYVNYAKNKNLLPESIEYFTPEKNILRGEVAEILYRMIAIKTLKVEKFSTKLDLPVSKNSGEYTEEIAGIKNTLAEGEIKIILTWYQNQEKSKKETEKKVDLDSHLIEPNNEEIYFLKKIDSNVDTILELQNQRETTTIRKFKEGNYEYFVNKFSGEKTFAQNAAKVEIYDKNGLAKIFYPPDNEEKIWKVFELNDLYEITEINEIGTCELITSISIICPEPVTPAT